MVIPVSSYWQPRRNNIHAGECRFSRVYAAWMVPLRGPRRRWPGLCSAGACARLRTASELSGMVTAHFEWSMLLLHARGIRIPFRCHCGVLLSDTSGYQLNDTHFAIVMLRTQQRTCDAIAGCELAVMAVVVWGTAHPVPTAPGDTISSQETQMSKVSTPGNRICQVWVQMRPKPHIVRQCASE